MIFLLASACYQPDTAPSTDDSGVEVDAAVTVAAPEDPFGVLTFEGEPHANLLVLSIDTLRKDAVGRYAGTNDTPVLDGLLGGGVAFDQHQTCGNWTYPNLVCALSGQYSTELGYVPTTSDGAPKRLPGDIELMASLLQAEGFTTAAVSTNGYFAEGNDMLRGYEFWEMEGAARGDWVVESSVGLFDDHLDGTDRWLLHAHFFDPHSPYAPPEEYLGELEGLEAIEFDLNRGRIYSDLDQVWPALPVDERKLIHEHLAVRYRASIQYLDDQVGQLLAGLEERGALDDTVVLLWSDHGEQLFDHGRLGHGKSAYQQEIAGIAGVSAPGLEPLAWSEPTGHHDLLPTAWQLLGLEKLDSFTGDVPGTGDLQPTLSYEYRDDLSFVSAHERQRKLVYHWNGDWDAFALVEDPLESDDLGEITDGQWGQLHELVTEQALLLHEEFFPDGAVPVGLDE